MTLPLQFHFGMPQKPVLLLFYFSFLFFCRAEQKILCLETTQLFQHSRSEHLEMWCFHLACSSAASIHSSDCQSITCQLNHAHWSNNTVPHTYKSYTYNNILKHISNWVLQSNGSSNNRQPSLIISFELDLLYSCTFGNLPLECCFSVGDYDMLLKYRKMSIFIYYFNAWTCFIAFHSD